MRTVQEKRLEEALFNLIKNASNMLSVEFYSHERSYRDSRDGVIPKSLAYKQDNQVELILIEPTAPIELDQWAEAIVKAEELIEVLRNERSHDYQNPNYFKAILARFHDLKHQPYN